MLFCSVTRSTSHRDAGHRGRRATTSRGKRTWPKVGHIGLSGALRPLPDAMASRCGPRLLDRPICPIRMTHISPEVL